MDETIESQPIKLKGVGDSLWVTFDPTLPAQHLETELEKLFDRMKHLAINAKVVLDPGPHPNNEKLFTSLGDLLKKKFNVAGVSKPIPKKQSVPEERIRQRELDRSWQNTRNDCLLLAGRVRSGQTVVAKKHLLILGDVNPGAQVEAAGNIIIMGTLSGAAVAGQPNNEDAMIIAVRFKPTQIQIGGFVAAGIPASSEDKIEYAHVEDGKIIVDEYLKVNPFSRLPWPQAL